MFTTRHAIQLRVDTTSEVAQPSHVVLHATNDIPFTESKTSSRLTVVALLCKTRPAALALPVHLMLCLRCALHVHLSGHAGTCRV